MTPRRWPVVVALVVLAALVCGCSTLPTSGTVHTRPDDAAATAEAPYFAPPGPSPGDSRDGVVRGFLLAMQANPPSTAVAREFLSRRARSTWKPVDGTIVYDGVTVDADADTVYARLRGAHRLDPRGGWDTGSAAEDPTTIPFALVREDGEWRIDKPPQTLAVPESDFSSLFVPFYLYFFDRTGTVLVPTRVYLPRGEQTSTNLVRALLAGPGSRLDGVVRSAFPPQTDLDLAVVVKDGVAEVPLGQSILDLPTADLNRAVVQLAWTLGQVSGVSRIRLTADDATVPLPDGETEVGVREGQEYDPVSASASGLVGIAGKRVIRIDGGAASPIGGPLGREGVFALRSVALDADQHRLAAVAASGRRVYLAPDRGSRAAEQVQSVVTGASDVLRPAFDRFGGLWLVDRTSRGAVVHVITGLQDRVLRVPGITGRRLSAFALTRDGTQLLATLAGQTAPQLLVAALVRDGDGRVVRARAADQVDIGADLGQIRDVTQSSATTAAVLSQPATGPGLITTVELDGSPGDPAVSAPALVPGPVLSMAISPDPHLTPWVVATDDLLSLASSGRWVSSPVTGVLAASYPQ